MWKHKQNSDVQISPEEVLLIRKKLTLSLVRSALVLAVLAMATLAWFASNAWFAMNRKVTGSESGITAASASASLFISGGNSVDNLNNVAYEGETNSTVLYPISTVDCTNWFYASEWESLEQQDGSYKNMAKAYTAASTEDKAGAVTYTNLAEGGTKTAYLYSEYMLYSSANQMDVYLAPDNPITVSYGKDVTVEETQALKSALRVGIKTADAQIIYAPVAESGTGNSKNAEKDTFCGVKDTSTVEPVAVCTDATLDSYKAAGPGPGYTAGESPLATEVGTTGTQIKVYVWMEGTDAQAMADGAAGDIHPLSVTIKYVGVESASPGS